MEKIKEFFSNKRNKTALIIGAAILFISAALGLQYVDTGDHRTMYQNIRLNPKEDKRGPKYSATREADSILTDLYNSGDSLKIEEIDARTGKFQFFKGVDLLKYGRKSNQKVDTAVRAPLPTTPKKDTIIEKIVYVKNPSPKRKAYPKKIFTENEEPKEPPLEFNTHHAIDRSSNTKSGLSGNLVTAAVLGKQTAKSGRKVRFRVTKPVQAGNYLIKENSIITAVSLVGGNRILFNSVSVADNTGQVLPISLSLYDKDMSLGLNFDPDNPQREQLRTQRNQTAGDVVSDVVDGVPYGEGLVDNALIDAGGALVRGGVRALTQGRSQKKRNEVELPDGYKVIFSINHQNKVL
ncbi:conjugative transposon protein TraM [Dyadobacter flavalbus]|uniref:Conjugative transposon protein TraM n=1 Tax=Dyadobacter flavalbus TaxID=2579942 RepID=A0A5M8QU50_9BACT|nr:conjugative transposon protein TraM [Dyadobacter flavalbus]KAA6437993.1 conjugative transposon protein TraM [Dyadobacter flavalbus]